MLGLRRPPGVAAAPPRGAPLIGAAARRAAAPARPLLVSRRRAPPSRPPRVHAVAQAAASSGERAPLDDAYILGLLGRQWRPLAAAGAALAACVAMNLASPVLQGALFETLVAGRPFAAYRRLLAALVAVYAAEPLLTVVYVRAVTSAGEAVQLALRLEAFRVLLMQRVEFFDRRRASDLTALLATELEALRGFLLSNVSRDRGARAVLELAGATAILCALAWRLGPVLAAVVAASGAAAFLYRAQTRACEAAAAAAQARMAAVAGESFSNIRTVRVFAGEALERERFGGHAAESHAAGLGFGAAKAALEGLNRGAVHASLLALYALGGWLVSAGLMTHGMLLTAIGYTWGLVYATQGALQSFADGRRALAALRRVQAALAEAPHDPSMAAVLPPGAWWDVANGAADACALPPASSDDERDAPAGGAGGAVAAAADGDLRLEGVTFEYASRPGVAVLRDLSLTLPRGRVTALVGRSGAGKSTVAALLERLYSPTAGAVTLGGRDVATFSRAEWVAACTAVTQEPVLFNTTVYENIAYGLGCRCSRADVEAAARAACAHDFIAALPDGYDTPVGERGGLLSGGQRQRVALARALLKGAPILVLDEATSALDAESEAAVQAAIDKLVEGRTVLVIAHRLATVQAAHQIVVLDGGRAAEVGTHAQLAAAGGLYAALTSSQALALSTSV